MLDLDLHLLCALALYALGVYSLGIRGLHSGRLLSRVAALGSGSVLSLRSGGLHDGCLHSGDLLSRGH